MLTDSQHLYIFLSSCSGSWRNTVFIAVQDRPGYLLSTGRDGQPIVMAVEKFHELTGESRSTPLSAADSSPRQAFQRCTHNTCFGACLQTAGIR